MNPLSRCAIVFGLFAFCFVTLMSVSIPAQELEETISGRVPAPVMSYRGAKWLERPSREKEEQPEKVLDVMNLQPGDMVCDLGCGTGYFARRMAKRVGPEGKVYAVDIQPEMLELCMEYAKEAGVADTVVPILGEYDNPRLPKGKMDWIIMADVYHEFSHPQEMLARMRESLAPGGHIVLLEYRDEDDSAKHIKPEHRMTVEAVLMEWNHGGFELVNLLEFLPSQHFFIFREDPDRAKLDEMQARDEEE